MSIYGFNIENYDSDKSLNQEICQMVFSILGDYNIPLPEVVFLIESIVKKQIRLMVRKAEIVSNLRNSKFIEIEDFVFVFRHDIIKLKRLFDFLTFEKSTKSLDQNCSEDYEVKPDNKQGRIRKKILDFMKNLGKITDSKISRISKNEPCLIDCSKVEQLKTIDSNYANLNDDQYVELINLRHNSFRILSRKRFQKLKIVLLNQDFKQLSDQCGEIIGFLFRELLNEILEKLSKLKNQESNLKSHMSSNELSSYYRIKHSLKINWLEPFLDIKNGNHLVLYKMDLKNSSTKCILIILSSINSQRESNLDNEASNTTLSYIDLNFNEISYTLNIILPLIVGLFVALILGWMLIRYKMSSHQRSNYNGSIYCCPEKCFEFCAKFFECKIKRPKIFKFNKTPRSHINYTPANKFSSFGIGSNGISFIKNQKVKTEQVKRTSIDRLSTNSNTVGTPLASVKQNNLSNAANSSSSSLRTQLNALTSIQEQHQLPFRFLNRDSFSSRRESFIQMPDLIKSNNFSMNLFHSFQSKNTSLFS
ncbi:unnamed protein product [Brachionus calyciflorus]|uniref:Uncharacterized protein n=1 Tax=Brachionus calyciflorus TaxID=104777 RepID=A0A813Z6W6_9BILA|nr:unnamed protein product [Brachionus calyciflorus]